VEYFAGIHLVKRSNRRLGSMKMDVINAKCDPWSPDQGDNRS
jgi:hypothetical protein